MPKLPHREVAPAEEVEAATDTTEGDAIAAKHDEKAPSFRDQVISKIREEDPSVPVKALQQAFAAGAYEARQANADQFIVARVLGRQALEDEGAERCMVTLQIASIRSAADPNPVLSKPVYVFVPIAHWRRYPANRQFMVQLVPIAEQQAVNVAIATEPGAEN